MISTGIQYLDKIMGGYKLGDNIVWQISDGIPIDDFIKSFFKKENSFNRNIIYVNFNYSPHTVCNKFHELFENQNVILLDAFTHGKGNSDQVFVDFYEKDKPYETAEYILIENPKNIPDFIESLKKIQEDNREGSFYIFDSLTGMSELWKIESNVLDFFTYTCPKLYDLNTLAYWIYEKEAHSKEFMAGISHTTQIIFSLQNTTGEYFDFKIQKLEGRPSYFKKSPHQFKIVGEIIQFLEKKEEFLKIGEKVKTLRKKNNKTQAELAALLGLTPGAVSQIENSIISPSLNTLLQISSIFSKSPEYFIEDLVKEDKNNQINIISKKEVKEYSNKKIIVSDLVDNNDLPAKIFSVNISEKQSVDGPLMLHKGNEFLYVTEGSVYITIDNIEYQLKKGESILLNTSFIAKVHNKNDSPCEFIYILL